MYELIMQSNGIIKSRETTDRVINISEAQLEPLFEKVLIKKNSVASLPDFEEISLCASLTRLVWTVPIKTLNLNCRYRLVSDNILTPDFGSLNGPQASLAWPVPESLRLRMLIEILEGSQLFSLKKAWLFAFDSNGGTWRLPLGNIYEDCSLCLGVFKNEFPTQLLVVGATLRQFQGGGYNSDLWDDADKTAKMFQFDPTAQPFQALPPDSTSWTNLCQKVSSQIAGWAVL